jgi:hypothetical protein
MPVFAIMHHRLFSGRMRNMALPDLCYEHAVRVQPLAVSCLSSMLSYGQLLLTFIIMFVRFLALADVLDTCLPTSLDHHLKIPSGQRQCRTRGATTIPQPRLRP